jgi:2-polyprenyl-3-methyl-5-hydroxy-6-metoxy-1,4-benzoquinol methylase
MPRRVLHLAPEYCLESSFRRVENLDYVTADLEAPADIQLDLTDCPLPSESFDLVICLHILEHIPDDHAAMRELHRIIRRDGIVIVDVPFNRRDEAFEPATTDPQERLRLLGQHDHVRLYGRSDLRRRLQAAGFDVSVNRAAGALGPEQQRRMGLPAAAALHICRRAAATSSAPDQS